MGTEIEVIEHTVTVADATVSRFGFGIPLIAAQHNYWPELVRAFDHPDSMTKAPYNVPQSSALYQMARTLKSQQPSPPVFKVGKLTGTFTHTVELTVQAPAAPNTVYAITIDGSPISITASPPETADAVATSLLVPLNTVTDITATAAANVITIVSDTASTTHAFTAVSPTLAFADTTPAASVLPSVDLAAIRAFDGDWYALLVATPGSAAVKNTASWVETQTALFLAAVADANVPASSTSDVATALMNESRHRSSIQYHPHPAEYLDAALAGIMLPKLPGPATFANKGLSGVSMQGLDASARQYLKDKNANCYLNIKGLGFTLWGTAASGRFLDVTVAIDWFDIAIEDRIISLLRNNDVVPYTAQGIELVRSQIYAQILDGIGLGIIDGASPYSATAPALEAIDPNLKAGRILPDMRYTYRLSGAIHKVRVIGVVQV